MIYMYVHTKKSFYGTFPNVLLWFLVYAPLILLSHVLIDFRLL